MAEHVADSSKPSGKLGLVLAGVDDTPASLALCDFLAKHFAYHDILLTHVHCKENFPTTEYSVFSVQNVRDSLDKEAEKKELIFVKGVLLPRLEASGVIARGEVVSIDATGNSAISNALCKRATALKPEFLVLSKHSKSAVARFFIGSVTKDCVAHAPCPVAIV